MSSGFGTISSPIDGTVSAGLPIDEAWDQISPVGREFGSRDYEHLAELDARVGAAKAAFDAMKMSRSGMIDQVMFSKMRKRGRR